MKNKMQHNNQKNDMKWHDPKEFPFQLNGFAWLETDKIYRRFPVNPIKKLPTRVDELANSTSGGQIRFKTDANKLAIKVKLSGPADMSHMTAVGQCGFDVYLKEGGKHRYISTAIPPLNVTNYESVLWDFISTSNHLREATINFPLYQGVEEVLIGTEASAVVHPPTPYISDKRVIFYGSSITQGACASRPGMSYTNILSRRFNLEFINLGFSGSGKGEREVALSIREIERPGCLVLDFEANSTVEQYKTRLLPFIKLFREYHPTVPIIVASRIPYAKFFNEDQNQSFLRKRNISISSVAKLQQEGDERITFLDGSLLLGEGWHECTVDGVHPNEYGFMKMADGFESILRSSLKSAGIL